MREGPGVVPCPRFAWLVVRNPEKEEGMGLTGFSYERGTNVGLKVIPGEVGHFRVRFFQLGDCKNGIQFVNRFQTHRLEYRVTNPKLHVSDSVNRKGQNSTGKALGFRSMGLGLKV